jgi:hypothetical protein
MFVTGYKSTLVIQHVVDELFVCIWPQLQDTDQNMVPVDLPAESTNMRSNKLANQLFELWGLCSNRLN